MKAHIAHGPEGFEIRSVIDEYACPIIVYPSC